jgi:cation diffusion facilitator family transporter
VVVGLVMSVAETAALAAAAGLTGSAALITQTATSLADVAGSVFLAIGVVTSERMADERHPLGYGRERFFWSFVAAVGVFVGGFGAAVVETVRSLRDPLRTGSYPVGYAVLVVTVALNVGSLLVALRPLLRHAAERGITAIEMLWRGTDPAATTVVLTSAAGVAGGVVAAAGLAGTELTQQVWPDAVASSMIGLVLLGTSVVLLHTNRELLTGRGLPAAQILRMRRVVAAQVGVEGVPDLFGIVIGPATVIVNSDVVFEDGLDVPAVEAAIVSAAAALRREWPAIAYVYLNPVSAARPRRVRAPL